MLDVLDSAPVVEGVGKLQTCAPFLEVANLHLGVHAQLMYVVLEQLELLDYVRASGFSTTTVQNHVCFW